MYMLGYLFQKSTFEGLIRKKGRIENFGVGGGGVCIPLRGNAVCILFISSERVGIF